ncbi:MAG: signal peptidase II [Actinomycetota bacterium]|nr:signal peptidase II [Actinomycetota bacterium]
MQERGAQPALSVRRIGRRRRHRWVLVVAVASVVVAADQATKWWALRALDGGRTIDLVWTLRLRLLFNSGTAFGFGGAYAPVLALVAVAVVIVLLRTGRALQGAWPRLAMGLVLGGAVGNLADRALRGGGELLGGAVVDFIDLQWWPVFNVADMAITGGAVLLALTSRHDDGSAEPGTS